MHYLTVQDVLWIHLQIAKKTEEFSFAKLEEAVSYQYAYGKSKNLVPQAVRYFSGFASKAPFTSCNKAVGFASGVAFLALNGRSLNVAERDIHLWLENVSRHSTGQQAIENGTQLESDSHHASTRDVLKAVLEAHEKVIASLTD